MKGGVAGQYESHSHFTVGGVLWDPSRHMCIPSQQRLMSGHGPLQMPGLYRVIKVSGCPGCGVLYLFQYAVGGLHPCRASAA